MTYGVDEWGFGEWGSPTDPPLLASVDPVDGGNLDELGGDLILVTGDNFDQSAVLTVELGGIVLGTCHIFDFEFDLTRTNIYAGSPAAPAGTYHLRVTTDQGSAILENSMVYEPKALEYKVESVRRKWARVWDVGVRALAGS